MEQRNLSWYAQTKHQKDVAFYFDKGLTQHQIAKAMNISRSTVKDTLHRVRAYKETRVFTPEVGAEREAPEGFTISGASVLEKLPDGGLQWTKYSKDMARMRQIMQEAIASAAKEVEPYIPTETAGQCASELLSLYTLTDYHLGMFAHADECGDDWNTERAVKTFQKTFAVMVESSPPSEVGVLNIQGDFLHSDSLEAVTPAHKNILDQDSRYHVIVAEAVKLIKAAVQLMLTKHAKVTLLIAQGNHDLAGSCWLQILFNTLYETDERINVIVSANPYYCITHGKTMLAFHHGHRADMGKFAQIIPAQFPKQWGETEYRYGHVGHRHHAAVKENYGIIIEQHQTLAPKDAHAANGGYIAERSAKLIVYSKEAGECMSIKVRPQ